MSRSVERSVLERIILFLVGVLVSQWIFVIEDLSLVTNAMTVCLILVSVRTGMASILKENKLKEIDELREVEEM